MDNISSLKEAVLIQHAMMEYRDTAYMNLIRQINTKASDILKDNLGSQFVKNCGRDIAGEVVRNYFDTSDYHITVDQLAIRILKFTYEDEYDPLRSNEDLQKRVYNYNDINSSTLEQITKDLDANQSKLFPEDRKSDYLDQKGKKDYRASRVDENGDLYDELTGQKGEKSTIIRNGKEELKSDLHADHVQAREAMTYNAKYIKPEGVQELKEFINSNDNMQMIHASANTSKGDVRVCKVDGKIKYCTTKDKDYDPNTDITHRATPEQLAEATIQQWEKDTASKSKAQVLKDKGYLNEDGKVPKSVRKKLEQNIRHSQNEESKVILKNTKYGSVAKDAVKTAKNSVGKILAGQIIYYAVPPLIYEVKTILQNGKIRLKEALEKITAAGKRICTYISSHLKDIFKNLLENSLKNFIKAFMDILIGMVKATVKKMLKLIKNVVMSTVDAIKIIATPGTSKAEKADAVVNLFGITITNFVVEVLFEIIENGLHIPEFLLAPLQLITSVICTNLTMLVLQKADLFDVRFGFKLNALRAMFAEEREKYNQEMMVAENYTNQEIERLLEKTRKDSREIYQELVELDPHTQSVRSSLNKVNQMFQMNINFEAEWLRFIGINNLPVLENT